MVRHIHGARANGFQPRGLPGLAGRSTPVATAGVTEKEGAEEEVETSLTFDHPVVGVIFSSDRLDSSDAAVGSALEEAGRRGLDSGEDEILLSEDRRTLNLRFRGGGDHAEQVRVLVALN